MADDHPGGTRLDGKPDPTEVEDAKVPIPLNHQLALALNQAPKAAAENAVAAGPHTPSLDGMREDLSKPPAPGFGFDGVGIVAAKRARGRPRKDFSRSPNKLHVSPNKHHVNTSVAAKVMRGRGRPKREDILHHKIFPGRPRFRGKKFFFGMSQSPQKLQNLSPTKDIYDNIDDGLKLVSEAEGKMLLSTVPDTEIKIEKFCAFCNLSESSVLGQGRLSIFKPTVDFNCFESMDQKRAQFAEKNVEVSSESRSELKLLFRKQKSSESSGEQIKVQRSKSLQLSEKSSIVSDLFQELEETGFKTPPVSTAIFETSGDVYAHFNCAAWSDGVTKTFEKKLFIVDKAVVVAVFQRCSKCDRFGASVKCCFSDCTKIYHYPCAIVSGALQNANCFKIICSIHREHAFSFGVLCMACHESGDLSKLLLCTKCANYYHGNCLEPPITPSPDVRAGWQCFECKVCQNCRRSEDGSKLLVCNTCDKGYHPFCLKPAVSSVPKSGWKCTGCRMCGDCGARTPGNGPSSRWHLNYTVCDSCYQQRNKGVACPLCGKAYRQFSQRKAMKHCNICQKYIHPECDRRPGMDPSNYVCPCCTSSENRHHDETYVEHHIKDTYHGSSRDSFLSGNEDTLSSEESDYCAETTSSSKISSRRTSSEQKPRKPRKSKLKALAEPDVFFPMTAFLPKEYKLEDDETTDDNKMVLTSATDEFVLCQDLCVMCGSFGKGEEGKLIVCAQCGQCYHSYCANIKVTNVVLKKGWRCLDCTVCEGCGQPHDESRLILCDECDISFHIYCLDPPLLEVPQGNWKCKMCVMCIKCGSKSPGLNCKWQNNYTLCGPCASFTVCCLCIQQYEENELIIQCGKCERWLHGMCDQIDTEEQAEKCADYGYTCPLCRSPDELPPHLLPPPSPPTPEEVIPEKHASPIAKVKEPDTPVVKVKPPVQYYLDGVYLSENGMKYIRTLVPEEPKKIPRPRKLKHSLGEAGKSFLSLEDTSLGGVDDTKPELSSTELGLKAYDFEDGKMVMDGTKDLLTDTSGDKKKRPRKLQKLGIGGFSVKPRGRLSTKETSGEQAEQPAPLPPEVLPPTNEQPMLAADGTELKKKPKRKPKKKTQLDETFPSYLRDAFFGKELLMSCKKMGRAAQMQDTHDASTEGGGSQNKLSEEFLKSNPQPFPTSIGPVIDSKSTQDVKDFVSAGGIGKKNLSNTNLTCKSFIKSEIESIKEEHLSTASALSEVSGLQQIDINDIEDVFQGVLRDSAVSSAVPHRPKNSGPYLLQQGMNPGMSQPAMHPNLQNLQHADSNSSWPDSDGDQSQVQKNILKWESDERLGLLSTISPVLYANVNLPHLKIEFPVWTDRVKQIAKVWRSLPSEKRQPYLQRARDNRAASRSHRSSSTDSDRSQRESKTMESDQEKWKAQAVRAQQQAAAQQRLMHQQRVQAALKAQTEKMETSPSVSEMDKNIKLFHSKSLSEIPQFPTTPNENILAPNKAKIFEKRWSSSAIDLNTAENLLQGNKLSLETQHPTLQKSLQDRIANTHLQVSKVHSPPVPQDTSPSPNIYLPTTPKQQQQQLLNSRVAMVAAVQKDTPPSTPRPHSSESFFQMSASPQSQLLASLDTHSQPTPARGKMGPGMFEPKPPPPSVMDIQPTVSLVPVAKAQSITVPPESPKSHIPQPVMTSVDQFVLQQAASFPASTMVKQLSLGTSELLSQDQNLEQFLQSSRIQFQNKVGSHQHLRDLLQNKKPETERPIAEEGKLIPTEPAPKDHVSSPGTTLKLSEVIADVSAQIERGNQQGQEKMDASDSQLDSGEGEKMAKDSSLASGQSEGDMCPETGRKRKTTAGDLINDLESQQEEHDDAIVAGVNLDVLAGDVGELEFDDDELLGLGNDFNILEYADPELDKALVGVGDKSNILDEHLDLDDKDEELEDEITKDEHAAQEKHMISQEMEGNKKSLSIEDQKPSVDQAKTLPESFLNFDKKDLGPNAGFDSNAFKAKPLEQTAVEQVASTIVKEEPKQAFSSCSLSSQTYSPSIDIKLEKGLSDPCNMQQKVAFATDTPRDTIIPPPAYRTPMKQQQHPPKSPFPLHLQQQQQQSNKPLLLQDQPLLLEDLVEQEKREQRRQEGLIPGDALLSDIDFERLKDDVFSGPPDDSLLGAPAPFGGPPPYSLLWQGQEPPRPVAAIMQNLKAKVPPAVLGSLGATLPGAGVTQKPPMPGNMSAAPRPFAPTFAEGMAPVESGDPEKLKQLNYEKYLMQQHAILSTKQKFFETEVIKLRKAKKALNAKQRQLRKNGSELAETDAHELARVSQEQAVLQKQLEQVRKQFRQNTTAVQDYRLKQQKRQQQQMPPQQQQQTVPRSPLHTNVSSLQSSPQNSQSPLQFTHGAPQSPMMPSSPVTPSGGVRIQHSPSPLMQSPSPMAASHQPPMFQPQQLPLQYQLQQAKVEQKGWPNPAKMQQGESLQAGDRFLKREMIESSLNSQFLPAASSSPLTDSNLKSLLDIKKGPPEDGAKKDSPSGVETSEDSNFPAKTSSQEIGQSQSMLMKETKMDVDCVTDSVPQSILNQGLPSSVSNTLKFTLRQTGMPTGCLPAADGGSDNTSELAFSSPTPDIQSKITEVKPLLISAEKKVDSKDASTAADAVVTDAASNKEKEEQTGNTAESEDKSKDADAAVIIEEARPTSIASSLSGSQDTESKGERKSQDTEQNLLKEDILANIKREVVEEVPTSSSNITAPADIKIEPGTGKEVSRVKQSKRDTNDGSSDEELDHISKSLADKEREQAEQNVLLKQLLQNYPSAETPRTSDTFIELRKEDGEDLNKLDGHFDINDLNKNVDLKSKKPSYLEIRRAQLEKEPTPPPGEKAKPIKRKRPKKKKLDQPMTGKPDGVVAKKKCRRSSSKLEEGYDTYGETFMTKLTNLPPLRILEPTIEPNYSAIPIFGAPDLSVKSNKEHQLKGTFGNASIPGQHDIYSFHPYSKETASSSAILPPSSPPYRGFFNQEFPGMNKAIENKELSIILKSSSERDSRPLFRDGSPDTVVSSSSPECCMFESKTKYPKLVFIDHLVPEKTRNGSPVIPLLNPVPIRLQPKSWDETQAEEMDEEKDKENIPDDKEVMKTKMSGIGGYSAPLKDSGNVAVTLTLSSAAAEDICGVLSALADLLKIPIPASYEIVERTATPPSQKLGLYRRSKNSDVSIHSLLNGKPRFCRHCDIVVLSAGIRKKTADLSYMSKEEQEEDEEVIFCSTNCYMQFALTHRSTGVLEEKEAAAIVDHIGDTAFEKNLGNAEDSLGSLITDEKDILKNLGGSIKHENLDLHPIEPMDIDDGENQDSVFRKGEKTGNAHGLEYKMEVDKMDISDEMDAALKMKWKSIKYRYYFPDASTKIKRKDESEKTVRPFYHTIKPSQMPKDERKCIFCHAIGDGETDGPARLLNVDVNKWVHLNCALWSYEVYETVNGALMNVETAFKQSRHLTCGHCHKPGASVRCFKTRCLNIYHFPCARKEQCAFFKDKTLLCPQHAHRGNIENKLDSVAVFRRVYINREEHKQVASMIQDEKFVLRIGSLIFLNIGQLLPTQIQAFHNANCIYPVGYKIIRMYWSMKKLGRRSQYTCTINEVSGKPEFCIQVKDNEKEVMLKDKSAKGVWQKVIYPIEKMRKQAKTIKIFPDFITGDDLFGLTEPAVLRIVESLPGVDTLNDYNFRYGRSPFLELPLAINPTGCARSEPKLRTHFKRSHTLHTSNSSRSCFHSAFAGMEVSSSPYIKQFVHSKSSQYRKMKTEWRNNVYLARSRIQGLGLYAARDMEKHTMVIEYIGLLIRNEISERNEAIYDAQNRGVYMFRLDENRVIDATLCGGLARYMNHSCYPNCVAEVVQIDRENKILIITNRKVLRGEELSYDYKFAVEDEQHKIPCLCGAPNCRKWMN